MTTDQARHKSRVDSQMEQASAALVERRYFDAEKLAIDALRRAHVGRDYDRMARILMPLQEARRQIRDMAFDSGRTFMVTAEVPSGRQLVSGSYLVCPPRVGVDGRLLRENAEKKKVAVIVVVREPTTRDGLWPLVAVGPVTVRARIAPPASAPQGGSNVNGRGETKASTGTSALRTTKGSKGAGKGRGAGAAVDPQAAFAAAAVPPQSALRFGIEPTVPPREWFLLANELLGDTAIQTVPAELPPAGRVELLMMLLEAMPDHEKLHQRLAEAAREAARSPGRKVGPMIADDVDELEAEAVEGEQ